MRISAIVSGHSRGLGAALAEVLLQRGARVLGIARHGNPALALQRGFGEVALDLADSAALTAWTQGSALTRFLADTDCAILINNAGLVTPVGPAGRQGAAALTRAVSLNVTAAMVLADAFVQASQACAERRIAHISSGAGRQPYPGWSAYCATKAALDMHAAATVLDRVPRLRIASVAPGVIDTDMQAQIRGVAVEDFPNRARFEALKRDGGLASPEQAARRFVDYLLSPAFGTETSADIR